MLKLYCRVIIIVERYLCSPFWNWGSSKIIYFSCFLIALKVSFRNLYRQENITSIYISLLCTLGDGPNLWRRRFIVIVLKWLHAWTIKMSSTFHPDWVFFWIANIEPYRWSLFLAKYDPIFKLCNQGYWHFQYFGLKLAFIILIIFFILSMFTTVFSLCVIEQIFFNNFWVLNPDLDRDCFIECSGSFPKQICMADWC